jgi:C2 domain in Dock180 and Zizimin proteins
MYVFFFVNRISLDPDLFATAHIRFLFRHCSSRGDKSEPKIFAFSFVRLMENNGATVSLDSIVDKNVKYFKTQCIAFIFSVSR